MALQMDTYTDASRVDESFGSEGTLWVTSENGKPLRIAYLTFEGMIKLPQQISSASPKIYVKEVERPGKVSLYLYDQAAMDIITWADQPEHDPVAVGTLEGLGPSGLLQFQGPLAVRQHPARQICIDEAKM